VGTPLAELLGYLDLEQIELNIFRGESPETPMQRIFGGLVAGQSLVAASRTVAADRPVHSLHAYFLRPGDTAVPVVYEVDRIRDGQSFTTRRVVAIQHGKAIFHLSASFQLDQPGVEHADPMPAVPGPEELPRYDELLARYMPELVGKIPARPIDLRYVGDPPFVPREADPDRGTETAVWMRADGTLPDDPVVHVCAATYASDLTLIDSAVAVHGLRYWAGNVAISSLDHAMWFHRPFRADEWFLYSQRSPSAQGSRGLATGQIFAADGRLVVSVVQEGLVRPLLPSG
jgi:acyl-CoA thioesterase-2